MMFLLPPEMGKGEIARIMSNGIKQNMESIIITHLAHVESWQGSLQTAKTHYTQSSNMYAGKQE
jgi:hypothetical protein